MYLLEKLARYLLLFRGDYYENIFATVLLAKVFLLSHGPLDGIPVSFSQLETVCYFYESIYIDTHDDETYIKCLTIFPGNPD